MIDFYAGLFITGLIYGFTICSFSCFPVVCTYIIGTGDGFSKGFKAVSVFLMARVVACTIVGMICGLSGMALEKVFPQQYLIIVSGVVFLMVGIFVFTKGEKQTCTGKKHRWMAKTGNQKIHMFMLGFVTGIMPCLPYTVVMAGAAASGSVLKGGLAAFFFGLGTSVSPILLFGAGAGWFAGKIAEKIPDKRIVLQRINGCVIAFMGIRLMASF